MGRLDMHLGMRHSFQFPGGLTCKVTEPELAIRTAWLHRSVKGKSSHPRLAHPLTCQLSFVAQQRKRIW